VKRTILGAILTFLSLAGTAHAESIGVSMALFDDNFLTVLRNSMQSYAKTMDGVTLQIEDAQNDVGRQLNQIQNFIASGVSAIVVNPVDTDATVSMTKLAAAANIPLVFVNRQPVNLDKLPKSQAVVSSDDKDSGTLETKEVCRLLKKAGKKSANIVVIMGELSNQAARQRTKDIHEVIATPECSFMKIIEEQTANWNRTQGQDLMTNWISAGIKFDAVVSNNDEMALGAIQALKAAKLSTKDVVVGGVDATQDGLAAMQAGDLHVTVFQDAAGQGKGAVEVAVKLARGQQVGQITWVPFQLVTPANMSNFQKKN
jgi:ABC-type sugar transport system substrate-binding protein